MIKIFIGLEEPVRWSLDQAILPLVAADSEISDIKDADLVIVGDKEGLHRVYNEVQYFAVLSMERVTGLPANAQWIPALYLVAPLKDFVRFVESRLSTLQKAKVAWQNRPVVETGKQFPPRNSNDSAQRILVVDDTPQNLVQALKLLGDDHFVTLSAGYDEGLKLIGENHYDVVLTDCQMPPGIGNSSLSVEWIVVGQKVPNGIFLAIIAASRGAKVAVVTDAGHHGDWVSALFDGKDLRAPHGINGQPVLFINYMGKRWDEALKALLSL